MSRINETLGFTVNGKHRGNMTDCPLPKLNSFQPKLKIRTFYKQKYSFFPESSLVPLSNHQRTRTITENFIETPEPTSAVLTHTFREKSLPTKPDHSRSFSPSKKVEKLFQQVVSTKTDPFYFANLARKEDFTSFEKILYWNGDTHNTPFLYLHKLIKEGQIRYNLKSLRLKKTPHCKCKRKMTRFGYIRLIYEGVPSLKVLHEKIPELSLLRYRKRRNLQYPHKVIVFNVEQVLIDLENGIWVIRPRLARTLEKLQFFFHIIFIYEAEYPGVIPFFKFIKKEEIKPSAIYEVGESLDKIVDYSRVYQDFKITLPSSDVMVISALGIPNEEIESLTGDSLISVSEGNRLKIQIERAPVGSYEYTQAPVCILIPRLKGNEKAISAFSLARMILTVKEESFIDLMENPNLIPVKTNKISLKVVEVLAEISADTVRGIEKEHCVLEKNWQFPFERTETYEFCQLHEHCVGVRHQELINSFVVMSLSVFMNNTGPEPLIEEIKDL